MSKNILSKICVFIAGAAVGSAATYVFVKTKYERIAQEEINSVREVYNMTSNDEDSTEESDEEDEEETDDYQDMIDELGYTGNIKEEEEDDVSEPYVISPEEYDEIGYETISLYYYEDGVLENAITREVIENASELIGDDFMDHFGEYEDDSVFVRNDKLGIDFEILKDGGYYSEVK